MIGEEGSLGRGGLQKLHFRRRRCGMNGATSAKWLLAMMRCTDLNLRTRVGQELQRISERPMTRQIREGFLSNWLHASPQLRILPPPQFLPSASPFSLTFSSPNVHRQPSTPPPLRLFSYFPPSSPLSSIYSFRTPQPNFYSPIRRPPPPSPSSSPPSDSIHRRHRRPRYSLFHVSQRPRGCNYRRCSRFARRFCPANGRRRRRPTPSR